MSTKLKQKLEQITLILFRIAGIVLLGIQIRKYYFDQLELTIGEAVVNLIAIGLALNPRFLLNIFNRIISSKFNTNKNDNREVDDK